MSGVLTLIAAFSIAPKDRHEFYGTGEPQKIRLRDYWDVIRHNMKRLHVHTSETAQGKVFVSFLSLIVRAYLLKQLKNYMRQNGLTLKKILLELDKIKTIQYPGSNEERLVNPLTKRQREIYELLEIPVPERIG